ncbi:MAG: hypothetical protein VR75_02520 [Hyphomonadaceae bacterium BRH_c29]|nr:MAG: hypothetical protein VR75_02520 [Hyphomonadaceae bacterium BRH_c29]
MEPVTWLPRWIAETLFWIYYNQTLIAGLTALAVGVITVGTLRQQIAESKQIESERNTKLHRANIAGLPITFVEIMDYAELCWTARIAIISQWATFQAWDQQTEFSIQFQEPPFPHEAFASVKTAIETADADDAEKLSDLLAFGQVHHSRSRSLIRQFSLQTIDRTYCTTKDEVQRSARDSLELWFRASRGLKYARRHSDHVEDLPGVDATNEFFFSMPLAMREEMRTYLEQNWDQHWHLRSPSAL